MRIIRKILVLVVIVIVACETNDSQIAPQSQPVRQKTKLTEQEIIKNEESAKKHEIKLFKGVFQQYNFKVQKYSDFIITPEVDQTIMVWIDVLWKQKDLYLLAPVQKNEDIKVTVSELNKPTIYSDSFYTMTGFKFKGKEKVSYKIVFTQKGKQEKLILLKVSEKIRAPKKAAKKETMQGIEQKLLYSLGKLQNALSETKTGQILDKQISSYVLHQSTAYSHFQILESFIVVLISCLQVMFVTKLLKNDSII